MIEFTDPCVHESGSFISRDDVLKFAYLTNDLNAIHVDDDTAIALGFERAIVHGMLVGSFISTALTDYFGQGTIYVRQNLKFVKPVLVDSVIVIKLQNPIVNVKGRTELDTNIWIENKRRKGGEDFIDYVLAVIARAECIPGNK